MLIMGALLLVSILAVSVSNRLGAPLLLTFLVVGMLADEEGVLGIGFDNPELAFVIGSLALIVIIFDGGMRTNRERFRVAQIGRASCRERVEISVVVVSLKEYTHNVKD